MAALYQVSPCNDWFPPKMVFSSLAKLRERTASTPQTDAIPDGRRIYAIGDIHGRRDLFDELIDRIMADHAARPPAPLEIILLGDLVDRGPDSCGVIARAIRLAGEVDQLRCLLGNHEEVFLQAVTGEPKALRFFLKIGGRETLASYGIAGQEFVEADFEELARLIAERVPASHVDFLKGCEDLIEVGDYVFVHAGIRPGVALDEQKPADLRWIREPFLNHRSSHGKIIVHGHSITEDVDERPNRIGIDTGAFASGRLTAVALEGATRRYLQTG